MILYTQNGCPQCKMVHMMMDKYNIKYEECQDLDKMRELGIVHTPTLSVDNKLLVGKELMNWINEHRG